MGYEVYEKIVKRTSSPTMTISKLGRFSFNAACAEILRKKGIEQVLLLWDKDARRIAVRSTSKKDARAYAVRFAQKFKLAGFAAKTFFDHIGYDFTTTAQYTCVWNDEQEMFEVEQLPADRFGVKKAPRLVAGKKVESTQPKTVAVAVRGA